MKELKNRIYLDCAATTPVDPIILKAMLPYFSNNFGNASSIHHFGQAALAGVDLARDQLAKFLGCQAKEIIFTSGASEADNLAVQGVIKASPYGKKSHIITSRIEHPAVLETCKSLEKQGLAQVSYVGVNKKGLVEVGAIRKLIKPTTVLVSIMYVNNEIGTIQPIAQIGKMITGKNQGRKNKIYFHTDAVQAANYLDCQVDPLGVDLLSLSGHKIYGPKGVGALYIRLGTAIKHYTYGGEQEFGLRPGTLNTAAIVGFGKAVELIRTKDRVRANQQIRKNRDLLSKGILARIKDIKINGDLIKRVPSNLNVSFKNVEGESLLLMLDLVGISVSTGSACASGALSASPILLALGLSHSDAHGSLRFTLGQDVTTSDINKVVAVLPSLVKKLRQIAPK
ncbi:MAG: cysteine desulfurase family protein [Patescibacteria group bacterium]